MALTVTSGNTVFIDVAPTEPNFAFAVWLKPASTANGALLGYHRANSSGTWRGIASSETGRAAVTYPNNDTATGIYSTITYSAAAWHLVAGYIQMGSGTGYAAAYLDGGSKGDGSGLTITPGFANRFTVGGEYRSSIHISSKPGDFAEAAVWDPTSWGVDTAARVSHWEANILPQLASKHAPSFFPDGLKIYLPLISSAADEGPDGLTVQTLGSLTFGDHVPGMIYPGENAGNPLYYYVQQ